MQAWILAGLAVSAAGSLGLFWTELVRAEEGRAYFYTGQWRPKVRPCALFFLMLGFVLQAIGNAI